MSQRFISNVALAIAGAVVVVSSQAFSASVTGWLMFGISLGVLALLAVAQRDRARGGIQRLLDVGIGVLALWSAVASVVYSGMTLTWMSFAEGLGFVALGVVGLIAHEMQTERVVHSLETVPTDARDRDRAEDLPAAA
ncbi:MAG TPA: hypothetical protein VIZ44_00710 [Gaiellaceae bacterium]|jgi:hypothetical protein